MHFRTRGGLKEGEEKCRSGGMVPARRKPHGERECLEEVNSIELTSAENFFVFWRRKT